MATVKFYLKRPQSDKQTSIFFLLNYGAYSLRPDGSKKYIPLKYYTNETIHPEKWDSKTGRPKAPTAKNKRINAIEYKELNTVLDNIEATAKDVFRRLKNDNITTTNQTLTQELDKIFKASKIQNVPEETTDLITFVAMLIEKSDKKPNTIKGYKQTKRELGSFSSEHKCKLSFDEVNLDFHLSFVEYLTNKGYSPNTIGARIKDVKSFMNEAYERGLHTNLDFKKRRFSKPKEETTAIYLNNDELKIIYDHDFSNNTKLDRVRDIFLIGCYTGLRFSDLSQLSINNITADDTISIKTQKTGKIVEIPVHTIVRSILTKYNNELPKIPSNQKFNEYVKDMVKDTGISEDIHLQKKGAI